MSSSRIPPFKSLEDEQRFWQKHDVTEFAEELTPVKVRFVTPHRPAISIHLTGQELRALQHLLGRLIRHHPVAASRTRR